MTAIAINTEKCEEDVYPQPFFFIKLEMSDGSSQLVRLTEKQIAELGIKVTSTANVEVEKSTEADAVVEDENYVLIDDTQNNAEECTEVNYQIIHPEDLNLKRPTSNSTHLPKGRPKKRPQTNQNNSEAEFLTTKSVKSMKSIRTRSGRITKPPKHFEKDFKKIDLMETTVEGDIVAKEFEPLRTNEKPSEVYEGQTPLLQLQVHRKRRIISGQYRCPTCNKAYLGQLRLIKHFQKYPDHGNKNANQKQYNSTWKYLIETSMKASSGSKVKTFCEELAILVQNARILAKYLFKLSEDETAIQIDDLLANVLGIGTGKYTLNENDLCKDVTLFSYLDMNYFDETYLSPANDDTKETKTQPEREPNKLKNKVNNYVEDNKRENNFVESNIQNHVKEITPDIDKIPNYDTVKKEKKVVSNNVKKVDYNIQNPLLSDVEGLILPEVDSSQNILDTSTNSDDIMNVDQFVNERFKKLTEPELDISNATLNLDLPSLEMFQFHGT